MFWVHVFFREVRLSEIWMQGLFSVSDAKKRERDSLLNHRGICCCCINHFPCLCEQIYGTRNLKRAASSTQSEMLPTFWNYPHISRGQHRTANVFWGELEMQFSFPLTFFPFFFQRKKTTFLLIIFEDPAHQQRCRSLTGLHFHICSLIGVLRHPPAFLWKLETAAEASSLLAVQGQGATPGTNVGEILWTSSSHAETAVINSRGYFQTTLVRFTQRRVWSGPRWASGARSGYRSVPQIHSGIGLQTAARSVRALGSRQIWWAHSNLSRSAACWVPFRKGVRVKSILYSYLTQCDSARTLSLCTLSEAFWPACQKW